MSLPKPPELPRTVYAFPGQLSNGMRLRDLFAIMALSGMLADTEVTVPDKFKTAVWCYEMADAMMEAGGYRG